MDRWKILFNYVSQFALMIFVFSLAFYLYVGNVLPDLRGEKPERPLIEKCNLDCDAGFGESAKNEFQWHFREKARFYILFVQIKGQNFSSKHSADDDNLDPHNFVWVENEGEPFLSLDLGYNVYSMTTLSRVVHHMRNATVPYELQYCLNNSTDDCLTANLAKNFLRNVTDRKGAMCYSVYYDNSLTYRCCKWEPNSEKLIKCDIPVVREEWMFVLLISMTIASGIAILYFPAIVNILPEEADPEMLNPNTQMNVLYQGIVYTIQGVYPTGRYWADVARKLFITLLVFPSLFGLHLFILWYVKEYNMPAMFTSHDVSEKWKTNQRYPQGLRDSAGWIVLSVIVSFLPHISTFQIPADNHKYRSRACYLNTLMEKEKRRKKNWRIPFNLTIAITKIPVLASGLAFRQGSWLKAFAFLPLAILNVFLSPILFCVFLIGYILHVSPLGEATTLSFFHFCLIVNWIAYYTSRQRQRRLLHIIGIICLIICCVAFGLGVAGLSEIICISLVLLTKFIAYTLMGLVLSAEYYSHVLLFIFTFAFYVWHCFCSVTAKYQQLLKLTFDHSKEKDGNKDFIYTLNEKGVPRIPIKLFQNVCDEILPRNEAYGKMVLKLAGILLFLCVTFSSVMLFSRKAGLNSAITATFSLITGIIPKLAMFISQGSSAKDLHDFALSSRVEKVVQAYLDEGRDVGKPDKLSRPLNESMKLEQLEATTKWKQITNDSQETRV